MGKLLPQNNRYMRLRGRIKYQSDLDPNFVHDIESTIGCDDLSRCIQCGECSAICPLSIYMDIPPRRIVAMIREGFKEEVLQSFTIWLCASCYACTVQCPGQIRITDIMYALKRKAIEEKVYPEGFAIPILSREFFSMVIQSGRNSEMRLVMRTWLKISIFKLMAMAPLGWDMFRTKRLSMKKEQIDRKGDLKIIMDHIQS
jgi:heterodisulfide reductase subunit C